MNFAVYNYEKMDWIMVKVHGQYKTGKTGMCKMILYWYFKIENEKNITEKNMMRS